ncbi:NAD-dependent dehydratase [Candidatus Roizmanbacteria bacterium RIFCSPHIGHO2_12_FULL_33_9]|uniref:NAD-dependent dehydratase n=1 Tax=Candidatus Roizmanbacteria bacterium RIFCSPHIGHO2_12_FULL_33_9 TaxID=1802045 RepID=A0A1F7HKI3_9BACT|nr:MAG: NAD-dependent dehydratase [Candidatus Roizmanbacteria bacterium RIFCSPHIGHO2_12_FULL_33_9]
MKIIVTGGAGFIGSHLCENLLNDNHEVICIDNLISGSKDNISHLIDSKNFTFIEHDVIKPLSSDLTANAVFHLASPASPNHHSSISYHSLPVETMLVNTQGTFELLKFCEINKAKFLFTSTSEVYGDPKEHPQKETYNGNVSTTGPRSVYDEAKRFGETITAHYFRNNLVDARIARIFNTYGPRMLKEDMRMLVSFIIQALKGEPITIFGDGKQTRSLCFVDDTVDGLLKLMFKENTNGTIINIGSSEEHTVLEYAQIVKRLTKSTSRIVFNEELPKDDPQRRKPDTTLAKQLLDWEPKVTLEEGINRMINYLRDI